MKLGRLRRRSGGVIDRRGQGMTLGSGYSGGGGGFPIPIGGGMGIVGIIIVLLLIFVVPKILGGSSATPGDATAPFGQNGPVQAGGSAVDPTDPMGQFVDAVTDDVQSSWAKEFKRAGKTYEATSVVLFTGATRPAVGRRTRRPGPSTARRTSWCTSTLASSRSSRAASARRATSPRPT